VKKSFPSAVLIMLTPPSEEEVRNRLMKRSTESMEKIKLRMKRMVYELEQSSKYDYEVVNDDLSEAIEQVEDIIKNEKLK
ncbi:MAG: guanylate kinase, partial [Clostridia bacterium]|nr:guanylate kinase [Clostridia bacterium]